MVILPTTILENIRNEPSTFGTKFVTLFPWSKRISNNSNLTFQIINASMNETAKVVIEYDDGLEKLKNETQIRREISNVQPNSYTTHKFCATIMTQSHEANKSLIRSSASRIYLSSSSPVSIVECIFISYQIVLPVTMAGNRYSFSIAPSMFSGIFTAYFIPAFTDSHISITTVTRKGLQRISTISRFYRGSMIYAYNSSINGPSTTYISGASPFLILLSMRTHLRQIPYESFACTMLMPLPNEAYSQIALRDDFNAHFAPLDSSKDYRTELFLAAPMQNCQSFTVITFRPNSTKLIDVKPDVIFDDVAMEWGHRANDAILLRFETYQNIGSFLDIIPAYSQYLTGRMCFIFKNESERLFLYDVPRQSDTFLLDGKVLDVEYIQPFENSFRYITMRKINTKKLVRGLHCLESKGRYLLFIFGGSEKMYGYVPAFNVYGMETSKWIVENNFRSYRYDIFGTSFITLFPWITTEDSNDDSVTVLTLEILNPHPYMVVEVNISYLSEAKGNLIEKTYNITPYTHRKLEINEKMTKLYAAYSDTIYKSNHDSRIAIKSSMPISVTQSCFFGGQIGESFAVLPLKMADRKYSFLLPKSIANNSHVTIYFLPTNQTAKISIVAKFDGKERFHEIEAKAEKNSPNFAYYGFAKELSLNLLSDNPFQVIIIIQRLLFANNTLIVNGRADFGCETAIPSVQNGIGYTNISNFLQQFILEMSFACDSTLSIIVPSDSNYQADTFQRQRSKISKQFDSGQFSFEPANMQHYFQLSRRVFDFFPTLYCNYTDFIPIAAQYVTGRSHFATHHYRNLIIIFMDKDAVNDLEVDGVLAADDIYELQTPYDCTYFTFKFLLSTVPVHYVQSSGRYVVHIKSDALQNSFHQYFVAFGTQMNMNKETVSSTEVTNRKPFTERVKVIKSYLKIWNRKVLTKQVELESTMKQLFTTDQIIISKQKVPPEVASTWREQVAQ
ncbi:unnamed protein product [Wuchereria bancrofti]|uniref:Uncharacterized protein n=2 Tax=Wuchereria bancrofti TaxID=6293 RepID=A0A3P7E286_WUCBA|nr:unnamed protein product [Wuchereria bancrofti]